jgi:phosphotransferase system enzyme I (PtsP)
MHVYEGDDLRVDGILRLIEAASQRGTLHQVLGRMCQQVARLAHADVVSVYVREEVDDGEMLTLRANVGFPGSALGNVRLAIGEGITGTAAEIMRPISASSAQDDAHYKHVPGLGEEQYPSLLAIPLMVRGQAAGVLVMQRKEQAAFTDAEVALGTALATTFAHALEHQGDASRHSSRSARLTGEPVVPGTALGRAFTLGTLEALRPGRLANRDPGVRVEKAFEDVSAIVRKAMRRVEKALPPAARGSIFSLFFFLEDQRLRSIALERARQHGIARGLRQVAREYAVATYSAGGGDPVLEQRAIEAENLCLLLATSAAGLPLPSRGEVLMVSERLTAFTALALVGGRGSAVVAGAKLPDDSPGVEIARAAQVPVLDDIGGLFAWVRPDDTLLVDADAGLLRVNPPATTIARYRHLRDKSLPRTADKARAPRQAGAGEEE